MNNLVSPVEFSLKWKGALAQVPEHCPRKQINCAVSHMIYKFCYLLQRDPRPIKHSEISHESAIKRTCCNQACLHRLTMTKVSFAPSKKQMNLSARNLYNIFFIRIIRSKDS